MRSPIVMPDLGGDHAGGADLDPALTLWFAQAGDLVYAGDRLVELLLDSATFDVSAPVTGRLVETAARPGERPTPGQVLGWIEAE